MTRNELHQEFIQSLRQNFNRFSVQRIGMTGCRGLDKEMHCGFQIGDNVQRVDDLRKGKILRIAGQLVTTDNFKCLITLIRKL